MNLRTALFSIAFASLSHPALASVDADSPVDGAAVDAGIYVSYDSQSLDTIGASADLPISTADVALSTDSGTDSPSPRLDGGSAASVDVALVADASAGVDLASIVDGGARGVDGGAVDSGPKPILLVDGGAQGLVKDDRGCSISAVDGRRHGDVGFGLLPFLTWVAIRVARRRGHS